MDGVVSALPDSLWPPQGGHISFVAVLTAHVQGSSLPTDASLHPVAVEEFKIKHLTVTPANAVPLSHQYCGHSVGMAVCKIDLQIK